MGLQLTTDLPGHGLSGAVDYRSLDLRRKFVVDVTAILDQLEIAQATVVGNSLGGMYALWLALAAPEPTDSSYDFRRTRSAHAPYSRQVWASRLPRPPIVRSSRSTILLVVVRKSSSRSPR